MLYHTSTMGPQLIKNPKMRKTLKCINWQTTNANPQNAQNQKHENHQNRIPVSERGERELQEILPCVISPTWNGHPEVYIIIIPVQRGENESTNN